MIISIVTIIDSKNARKVIDMLRAKNRIVKIEKIKIPPDFLNSSPNPAKLILKTVDYINGEELSPIYLDKDYNLIDGYCSYLIYKTLYRKSVWCIVVKDSE